MPISVSEVSAVLQDKLRISGQNVITMDWPSFYKLNQMEKFRPERDQQLRKICLDEHGIIFASGNRGILAARDSNFAPTES